MGILLLFAFLSGLVTIAAPCIWPILPLVLSSSATGGHRKPLGITLGILISFGLLTLFLSSLIAILPFNANILRFGAVIVIAALGLSLLIPRFSSLLEGWVSRLSGKFNPTGSATGFWSGLLTGLVLGIVWAPCAGPILATIAALAATQKVSVELVWVTVSYLLGIGIPLFLFALLGRTILQKSRFLSAYTGRIQQVFGVIMIITAILIATGQDVVLEAKLLNYFPSYSQFLNNLEGNSAVTSQLQSLKKQQSLQNTVQNNSSLFNVNYPAPEFVGINKWLNLPEGTLVPTIQNLKGKVILVDFWTYTCINCIRTLPHVTSWYDKYKDDGFVVIGVHTPEFQFEHETQNVLNAIKQYNIHYPVAQDNDYATWNNYNNQYWPAEYLIDAQGNVRRTHFGEGEYDEMEQAIQQLLKEAGKSVSSTASQMPDTTPTGQISPETYLGSNRMQYYYPDGNIGNGTKTFILTPSPVNSYSLGGEWTINSEEAVAGKDAVLSYHFQAGKVYIILRPTSTGLSGTVKVLLDGKIIDPSVAGLDVENGVITVDSDRLYNVVDLHGKNEDHVLRLEFQTPGLRAYTFTFG